MVDRNTCATVLEISKIFTQYCLVEVDIYTSMDPSI